MEENETEGGLLWGDRAGDRGEGWGDPGWCSFHVLTRKLWVAPCLALLTPLIRDDATIGTPRINNSLE